MQKKNWIINVGILAGGTAVAQGITFLATIYLTRVYLPEDFGKLALLNSLVSLLAPISTLRYNRAISLAQNAKELKTSFFLTVLINISFFIVLSLASLTLWFLSTNLGLREHVTLLWILPLAVFFFGFTSIFQSYFEKLAKFKLTSGVALTESLSKASVQYGLHTILRQSGLLIGYLVSLVLNFIIYVFAYIKGQPKNTFKTTKNDLKKFAKKHDKFPKYLVWSNILDSASQNVCSITFPFLFSLEVLGYFSIAFKIVRLPAMLVSMATRRVYYPKAAELFTKDQVGFFRLYRKSTSNLFMISILPLIVVSLAIPWLFDVLFDASWATSAPYAQLILIYVGFNFVNCLAHENMLILGLQKQFLLIELIWLTLSTVLIFIAHKVGSPYHAVLFYALSGALMEVLVFSVQYREIRKFEK